MFTGRDEIVRHEQNVDARQRAETYRLVKQLRKPEGESAPIPGMFARLRSRISRFIPTLDAENHLLEVEQAANRSDVSLASSEPLLTQE